MGYDATAEEMRNAADMIDRLAALASAPAGDGVPVAWMYEKKSSVSDLVRRIVNPDRDNYAVGKGWTETALYPAPSRPRAAVGEEIEERATEIVEECLMRHGIDRSACEGTRTDARAILALQSPPAKVEQE